MKLTFWTASFALQEKETIGIILAKAVAQNPMVASQNLINATLLFTIMLTLQNYSELATFPGRSYLSAGGQTPLARYFLIRGCPCSRRCPTRDRYAESPGYYIGRAYSTLSGLSNHHIFVIQ
ncbi:MAG: hypothetical protein JJU13_13175 [Balneolaceae bacterium]|nr:hypothetical protein [Balneolaceae bacterium]